MEILVASAIGALTAGGVYLILRLRAFAVILGLALLSYAVNIFLFSTGRLAVNKPPVLDGYTVTDFAAYTDPLPQALVLTAIVISFGMTAVLVMFALGAYLEAGDDRIDMDAPDQRGHTAAAADAQDPGTDGLKFSFESKERDA
ncbi:MAG: Na+/H+ antiporter subunit [Pseudomonadota bacterium]|jgi:multicomponent K+:H+ antiporter subunit C